MRPGPAKFVTCRQCGKRERPKRLRSKPEGWLELHIHQKIHDLCYEDEGSLLPLKVTMNVLVCSEQCLLAWALYRSS